MTPTKPTDAAIAELIVELRSMIARLSKELDILVAMQADDRSQEFVRVNRITADSVISSSGEGVPYHHVFQGFVAWFSTRVSRRYCEWNGRLYYTDEALMGRMVETPALAKHVPGLVTR